MDNPYLQLKDKSIPNPSSNPYYNIGKQDIIGLNSLYVPGEKTGFAKMQAQKAAQAAAQPGYDAQKSTWGIIKNTLGPNGISGGFSNIIKEFTSPDQKTSFETFTNVLGGVGSGLTLGGSDWVMKKLVENKDRLKLSNDTVESINDFLTPSNETQSAIRSGFSLGASIAPYVAIDSLLANGLKYAAPKFVANHKVLAEILASVTGFNILGQTAQTFEGGTMEDRKTQAKIDTALGVAFPLLGVAFRGVKNTIFKKPIKIEPVDVGKYPEAKTSEGLSGQKTEMTIETKPSIEGGKPKQEIVTTNDVNALQNYVKGSGDTEFKIIKDLGKDSKGRPIMARHTFDNVTKKHIFEVTNSTNASNLAHEVGHMFDSKLGTDAYKFSSYLQVGKKEPGIMQDLLTSFAVKELGGVADSNAIKTQIEASIKGLTKEIDTLSLLRRGTKISSPSEKFADAISEIIIKQGAREQAPILTRLLEHSKQLNVDKLFSPTFQKAVREVPEVITKTPKNIISIGGKQLELSGKSLEQYNKAKDIYNSRMELYKNDSTSSGMATKKGIGMEFSAEKRRITGELTQIEKESLIRKERANYIGKKVEVDINGQKTSAKIDSKSSYGNTKVILEDGTILSVKNTAISPEKRTVAELLKIVTKREGVTPYIAKELPIIKEVPVAKELPRTPTGKKPKSEAFKAELITKDKDVETFINKNILTKVTGKERIGKSNQDIMNQAYKSDLTEESFNSILKDRFGNLSEDVVKMKQIMTDSASSLREKLLGRDTASLNNDELAPIMTEYNKLVELFEVFSGARTELSNSFRSLGFTVNPGENDILRQAIETIQNVIKDESDPFKAMQKLSKMRFSGPLGKYFEVWYPAVLSGIKTHTRNIVGNISNLTLQTMSKLFTKQGRKEFLPTVFEILDKRKEAWNNAKNVFFGNEVILSKFNDLHTPGQYEFKGPFAFLNKMEYVGRALNGADIFVSTLAKEGEIQGLRVGKYNYGLTDRILVDKINNSIGTAYAQMVTFRNSFEETTVSEIASKVSSLKESKNPVTRFIFTALAPFVKTIANITERRIDFLPLFNIPRTFFSKGIYEARALKILKEVGMAEGPEMNRVQQIIVERLRNQQMGRFFMGMSVLAAGIPLAMSGRITGTGPIDKNEREALMLTGWRPNSIILPSGVSLPYQNTLISISSILSVLGNINDAMKYGKSKQTNTELALNGFVNFLRSEIDQSFMQGISNIYDMAFGYTPKAEGLANLATNLIPIPNAWVQTKDIIYPDRYEAKTFNEQIRNKLGITGDFFGLVEPLQPKLNVFGGQVKADLIYNLTPSVFNRITDDPVLNFMKEKDVFIGKPNKSQTITGRKGQVREMTPVEYTQYVERSGEKIYNKLNSRISSGYFNRFKTKEDIKREVEKIKNEIREQEKRKFKF